ncbi:MAG: hypothetical protein JXA19_05935 [Anaerolineales bacterium]|nr:hypothetical protein [Anaerolineales bacterium]
MTEDHQKQNKELHICVLGGSCKGDMFPISEYLEAQLQNDNVKCSVNPMNSWETFGSPPDADILLQLTPLFSYDELTIPVLDIRSLLIDKYDQDTYRLILDTCKQVLLLSFNQL